MEPAADHVSDRCYSLQDSDDPADREAVSVQEAARRLGVHPNTIRNWIRSGNLEAHQPAGRRGRVLIPTAALRSLTTASVVTLGAGLPSPQPNGEPLCRRSFGPLSENGRTDPANGSSTFAEALSALRRRFRATRKPGPTSGKSAEPTAEAS